jgi:hypothetical protein
VALSWKLFSFFSPFWFFSTSKEQFLDSIRHGAPGSWDGTNLSLWQLILCFHL